MSGKGHKQNCHQGRRGGGLLSFFKGRPSLLDRSRRGLPTANLSLDEKVHSDDEIFREIEDYVMEAEREVRVQAGDPSYMCLHQTSGGQKE